jgi:hypothetical protein
MSKARCTGEADADRALNDLVLSLRVRRRQSRWYDRAMKARASAVLAVTLLLACHDAPKAVPPRSTPPATASAGAAYVLVAHSGVLRIANGKVEKILSLDESAASFVNLAASPDGGELWVSGWQGIRALGAGDRSRDVRVVKDGPLYEKLALRSPSDAWAVTSDIEWSVVHHDGKTWSNVRSRAQFPGRYEDNKLEAFVVTSDAVWVACWNGLWRGAGDDWQKLPPPGKADDVVRSLFVYRDHVIAYDDDGYFLRDGSVWQRLAWPAKTTLRAAVSDLGIVAAPSLDGPTVEIGSVDGNGPTAVSTPIAGRDLSSLAIDDAGRVWVGTDHALAVTDRAGHVLAQWTAGTLDGLTGSIIQIVVTGAGPDVLPVAKAARTWDVVGHIRFYKRDAPMPNARLSLCPSIGDQDCARSPFTRTATTGNDGSFRLRGVTEGELELHVDPPAGMTECETPFTVTGHSVVPSRDCHEAPGAPGVCDLGTLTDCLPFEMPPP